MPIIQMRTLKFRDVKQLAPHSSCMAELLAHIMGYMVSLCQAAWVDRSPGKKETPGVSLFNALPLVEQPVFWANRRKFSLSVFHGLQKSSINNTVTGVSHSPPCGLPALESVFDVYSLGSWREFLPQAWNLETYDPGKCRMDVLWSEECHPPRR